MALTDKLTAIADAIRGKTGTTDGLTLDGMAEAVNGLEVGGGGFPNGTEWSYEKYNEADWLTTIVGSHLSGWLAFNTANTSGRVYRSDDGITWAYSSLSSGSIGSAFYSDRLGLWFICAKNGIYYSTDRVEWTNAVSGTFTAIYHTFVEHNKYIYCFMNSNTTGGSYYSADGVSWTKISDFTHLTGITKRDGRLLGFKSQNVYYTDDGITWQTSKINNTYTGVLACGYDSGRYVARDSNNGIYYSDDGITWTLTDASGVATYASVRNFRGVWIVVSWTASTTSVAKYSIDGINWNDLSFDNIYYSGSGSQCECNGWLWFRTTNGVITSEDGINWNSIDDFSGKNVHEIMWDTGIYIASVTGGLYYSFDGSTWTKSTTEVEMASNYATSLIRTANTWCAVSTKSPVGVFYSRTWAHST